MSGELNPTVFAVIVTYNRALTLSNCINSLLSQVKFGLNRIHVVVNSHDKETSQLLSNYESRLGDFLTYEIHDNVGPAGGFNYGIGQFLKSKNDYVWLMDDDIVIRDNCLEQLSKMTAHHPYVSPRVIKANGEEVTAYGWWAVLLARKIVEKAGLPNIDLFYWIEDSEYLLYRLVIKGKIERVVCQLAFVEHLHHRTMRLPSWQYYYKPRNIIFYRLYVVELKWYRLKKTIYALVNLIIRIVLFEDKKLVKIRLYLLGTFHGLTKRLGKRIDPTSHP